MKGANYKARLVARGFEEYAENIQSDSPTIGKSAMRLLLVVAGAVGWLVKTTDIKSAFLQGREIQREIFIKPPKEENLPSNKVWKLRRCLYGLNDAALQFYLSVNAELKRVGCVQSPLDPSLFYSHDKDGSLSGILVSHIDDFLHCGSQLFDKHIMEEVRKRFLAGKLEEKNFTYVGFEILQDEDGITIDQSGYIDNLNVISLPNERLKNKSDALTSEELTSYRSAIGKLNWIVQGTRPDIAIDLLMSAMKFQNGTVEDIMTLNKIIKKVKLDRCTIRYQNMGSPDKWKLVLFSDASFANLPDGTSSAMAYILFVVSPQAVCPISWVSKKIRRVVKSTLAAETLALQEGLEESIYMSKMLNDLFPKLKFPVTAKVDCKDLVEGVYSTKPVTSKQLRIDMAYIKQCIADKIVDSINWVDTKDQLADSMTKKGSSSERLLQIFQSGRGDVVFQC
jgi:hypothetical protein